MPRNKVYWVGGAVAALGLAAGLAAQQAPESILPEGFGEVAPTPAPTPSPTPDPAPPAPVPESSEDDAAEERDDASDPEGDGHDDGIDEDIESGYLAGTSVFSLAGKTPWGQLDGPFHKILMRRLDVPLASRWAHIGLRNALLADAQAPRGYDSQDWLAERVWLLLRMGEADAARLSLAGTDKDDYSPKLAQVALQVALATSDPAAMCPVARRLDSAEPDAEPLVRAVCAALSAQPEIASDRISRARRGGETPAIDLALVDKLVGAGARTGRAVTLEWEPVERLNSWRFGLATGTGLLPPERLMANALPRVRAWTARAPLLTAEQRLPFARTATALGVFSGQALVDLYAIHYDNVSSDELGETDAFTLRQAFIASSQSERVAAMRQIWGLGEGDYERLASLAATSLAAAQISPSERLADDAAELIAAMLTAGYVERAAAWAPVVADMDEGDSDPAWAQLALALPNPRTVDLRRDRIADFVSRDDSEDKVRSGVLLASLAGLGRLDEDLLERLDDREELGIGRDTTLTRLIDAAASRGEAGTVLLLAGTALQSPDIANIPPAYLMHLIRGLREVGQPFLARMIAAEAIARA